MAQLDHDVYARIEGIEITQVHDGSVIFREEPARAVFLNPAASAVFQLCDGERSLKDIACILQEAFGLTNPPENDVKVCISSLLSEGLIVPNPRSKSGLLTRLMQSFRR
jgi:hypothetical protein